MLLLKCLAQAVLKNAVRALANAVPFGGAVYDIASDTWEQYRQGLRDEGGAAPAPALGQSPAALLLTEVQQLAQAPATAIRQETAQVVQAVAAGQPPEVQQALAVYLNQVPAMIRRSLRRPSDPAGKTIPSALRLNKPEDLLLPFLPPQPPRFKPGDRPLPGIDWELVELLGTGGFGEVWKARNPHFDSVPPVALKFCLDPAVKDRLLRHEAAVLNQVMRQGRHRHIVALQHTYLGADPCCLEYEYVEGGDLAGLMRDVGRPGKGLPATNAAQIVLTLAKTVGYTHLLDPPVVHRDLKPANILVQRTADKTFRFKIADFGIGGLVAAQAIEEAGRQGASRGLVLTTGLRGAYTPLYASPQQVAGAPPDPRDDVHALGVIWYQLLTGNLAILGIPPDWREEVQERGVGERMANLLASCIASRAEKRPATAAVLADELTKLLAALAPRADIGPQGAGQHPAGPVKPKEAESAGRSSGGAAGGVLEMPGQAAEHVSRLPAVPPPGSASPGPPPVIPPPPAQTPLPLPATQPSSQGDPSAPLIKWIVTAFRNLGGRAHLKQVYEEVRRLGYEGGGQDLDKIIRTRICDHSSDSPKFTGNPNDDLFRCTERRSGIWELREMCAGDSERNPGPAGRSQRTRRDRRPRS
jgi:serine/threonine protein kinase